MARRVFTASLLPPTPLDGDAPLRRADIVFTGVDQSGPSYEVRVFLNNAEADETTETTPEHGYAGSFHVYGYGIWPEGRESRADGRRDSPSAPARVTRYLVATEAVRRALVERGDPVTVTVVAVPYGAPPAALDVDLDFEAVTIRLDRPPPGSDGIPEPDSS